MAGRRPEIGFFLDGASTHRAETMRGYVDGIVTGYALELLKQSRQPNAVALPLRVEPRYRYNQTFASVFAILPGSIMLIMALIPPMLAALGVVREREIGSISNLQASPATVGEFLIGKQLPYVAAQLPELLDAGGSGDPAFRAFDQGLRPGARIGRLALCLRDDGARSARLLFHPDAGCRACRDSRDLRRAGDQLLRLCSPGGDARRTGPDHWAAVSGASGSTTSISAYSPRGSPSRHSRRSIWCCSPSGWSSSQRPAWRSRNRSVRRCAAGSPMSSISASRSYRASLRIACCSCSSSIRSP